MAKKAYIGVDGVARKIKKGYIGVDGKARKIKKAYIGIGGVARPCWSGGELAYYGTITALSKARFEIGAGTIGDYALFVGGSNSELYCVKNVDAYNSSLTKTSISTLRSYWADGQTATIGGYMLFAGGQGSTSSTNTDQRNDGLKFNSSLTSSAISPLYASVYSHGSTVVGNYALFAGGRLTTGGHSKIVTAYNSSITKSQPTDMNVGRYGASGATIGGYALFAGVSGSTSETVVDTYNASLTHGTTTALSAKRPAPATAVVGNYALFAGSDSGSTVVDAYNKSLTRSTITALPVGRATGATLEEFALFAGGSGSKSAVFYDESLTRTTATSLSAARYEIGAATLKNYVLFAGGYIGSGDIVSSVVDVYTVA